VWPRFAESYSATPDDIAVPIAPWHRSAIDASQSAYTSAADLAIWARALLHDGASGSTRVLKAETVREMRWQQSIRLRSSVVAERGDDGAQGRSLGWHGYGLGLGLYHYAGHAMFGHSGGELGFESQMAIAPDLDMAFVVLINNSFYASGAEQAITKRLLDWHYRLPPADWIAIQLEDDRRSAAGYRASQRALAASRRIGTSPTLPIEAYSGTYEHPYRGIMCIRSNQGGLTMSLGSMPMADLSHWHLDTFRAVWRGPVRRGHLLQVVLDAQGQVLGVRLGDGTQFTRVKEGEAKSGFSVQPAQCTGG
jgi:hypothetical protein